MFRRVNLVVGVLGVVLVLSLVIALQPVYRSMAVHDDIISAVNSNTNAQVATITGASTVSVDKLRAATDIEITGLADNASMLLLDTDTTKISGVITIYNTGSDATFALQSDDDNDGTFAEAGELDALVTSTASGTSLSIANRANLRIIDDAGADSGDAGATAPDNIDGVILITRAT